MSLTLEKGWRIAAVGCDHPDGNTLPCPFIGCPFRNKDGGL
jgi:hypothetical protein